MTTTQLPVTARTVPWTVRAAQVLLIGPLGLFQLGATLVFSATLGLHGIGDWLVAAWAPPMAAGCALAGWYLARRDPLVLRITFGLLVAQTAFSAVKLIAYHESAAYVFLGFVAAAASTLAASRATSRR
jgi:hypothetical protein